MSGGPPRLRCATYNIHRCIGRDGRHDPARTRRVLRELDADLVALQEVETLHDDPGLLPYLTEDSGWTALAGHTLTRARGHFGNAVLTRLPVLASDQVDISLPGREPRGALHLVLGWGGLRVQLLATHLGLRPFERRYQVTRLLELMQAPPGGAQPDLTLLMGDLNEWFLWGRPLRWLRAHFRSAPEPATFPAHWPLFSLDQIRVEPAGCLEWLRRWTSATAREASDHLPVLGQIAAERLRR